MKRHKIKGVVIRGVFGDKLILRLEKKAFGWHYWSEATEVIPGIKETSDGYKDDSKFIQLLEFRRQCPYSSNILFCITELLSNIWSVIRRFATFIIIPALIIILAIGLIGQYALHDVKFAADTFELLKNIAILYGAGILAPSFVLMGLGFFWRAVFHIDEKLKAQLRADGYDDDLADCRVDDE